ncbi:unnamed protein product [Cunninghamella echinulata]
MALAPQYIGHRIGASTAPYVLEAYLDYVCPFSAKIYKKLRNEVIPWLDSAHPNKVQFIFRQQVQPWHASSTLVHEAALAVEKLSPNDFFTFSDQLFAHQQDYFDESVELKTRRQLVEQIADLIVSTTSIKNKQDVLDLLVNNTPENKGNQITNDLKAQIRFARQNSIHVSPTVTWNGIIDNSVSSGWELNQWQQYIQSKL